MLYNSPQLVPGEIIVDEKLGIVTYSHALSDDQFALYYRSQQKWARPDLSEFLQYRWQLTATIGEKYLGMLRNNFQTQMLKASLWYTPAFLKANCERFRENSFLSIPPITQLPVADGYRNWRDRSNIVYYVENVVNRLHQYGVLRNRGNTDAATWQKQKQRLKILFKSKINSA